MGKPLTRFTAMALLAAGLAAAPALYAQDAPKPESKPGPMMGQDGMMGMMAQMNEMMAGCNQMMQGMMGGGRPNEQWQNRPPATPEQRG